MVNKSQKIDSEESKSDRQQSTNLNSKVSLIQRLRRGRQARAKFVESHVSKGLAFQIRSLREREKWSQQMLASEIGSNQNAVYRAENPNYGKQTLTTLRKIAAAFDVALVVRFVPFSELIDWVSGTPRTIKGLTNAALMAPSFECEARDGVFTEIAPALPIDSGTGQQLPKMPVSDLSRGYPTGHIGDLGGTPQSTIWQQLPSVRPAASAIDAQGHR